MPFTSAAWSSAVALSGIPPFSGFFSKDEILTLELARDDWHIVLGVLGYVGAFLTAVYTFRMIFRAFHGEPVEPARELEGGHLYHAPSTNPARARWRTPTSASRARTTTSPNAKGA